MPMIETDSPEVIERARKAIAKMAAEVRRYRNEPDMWPPSVTQATGYIIALIEHDLISSAMIVQLSREKDQAVAAALEVAKAE